MQTVVSSVAPKGQKEWTIVLRTLPQEHIGELGLYKAMEFSQKIMSLDII